MNIRLLILGVLLAPALWAQGSVTGKVTPRTGNDPIPANAVAVAIELGAQSAPFNELVSHQWTQAFDDALNGVHSARPFGELSAPVTVGESYSAPVDAQGEFLLSNLPFEKRLAVAVRVADVWRPCLTEVYLTGDAPKANIEIAYYPLVDDSDAIRIESWKIRTQSSVRGDLKFVPVSLTETLTLTNSRTDASVMANVKLRLLVPPGLTPQQMSALIGPSFSWLSGIEQPAPDAPSDIRDRFAWTLGHGDPMHGVEAVYAPGAQFSPDRRHPLNTDGQYTLGTEGETEFKIEPGSASYLAYLVFRRPVPAGGRLVIRVRHLGGVNASAPERAVTTEREFAYPLISATAHSSDILRFTSLVKDAHRSLLSNVGDEWHSTDAPALDAGETVQLVWMLTSEARDQLAAVPDAPTRQGPNREGAPEQTSELQKQTVFAALAIVFGLLFLGALVASVRKSRDEQLERKKRDGVTRDEILRELALLKEELSAKRISATTFERERARLISRAVDMDTKEP